MPRSARVCLALLFTLLSCSIPAARAQAPITTAERTGYRETSTHAEVMAFAEQLAEDSSLVVLDQLGESGEGRTLPLLIIADPPIASAKEARNSGKLIALLIGNIHGGEVCGKEALLMLARELVMTDSHPLLEDVIVCIAPLYNADGNERMAPGNRPGQVGPERTGKRHNAQNLDLNRDFIKAEAPETRALLRFFRNWDPDLFIDTHTTNGSHHRFVLTYAGPKHSGGDVPLLEYVRDTMLPRVGDTLREAHGHETFVYGNFYEDHTQWTTYPASPRYSTNYAGMRNRIGILSEAYSYATFEQRVVATLDFCRAILRDTADNADEVRALLDAADELASTGSTHEEPTPIRTAPQPLSEPATALGFVEIEQDGRTVPTEEHADYEVEVIDDFIGTVSVDRPWAYIVPGDRDDIATLLQQHGITVEVIREDFEFDAEVYTFESVNQDERAFQGHRMVTVEASLAEEVRPIFAGTYLVRTDQPLGNLIIATLEPEAEDSLVTWNFFDNALDPGSEYPVYRVASALPLLTAELPSLAEDRGPKKRITYEALYESRDRPSLSGSPMRSVSWKDDDHYTVRRDGERWLVEAATGRYLELVEDDSNNTPIIDALKTLDSLDDKTANRIGGSRRFTSTAGGRAIFAYENDLYTVALDGSFARRLTAYPSREELASLSPDGRYAAFVRDHDLYTVETSTGIERRLTTTGTNKVRNGKNAWVYYEEIFGRSWRAYWWAPDSSAIAFYETDSTAVDTFTLVDDAVEPQEIRVTEYPKPGTPNPHVRLGIVNPAGGTPAFVDLTGYTRGGFVISSMGWWPDSSKAYFTIQNRTQTWLDLCTVSPKGGKPTRLLRDSTEAWVEAPSLFRVLDDGSFLITSERSGWKHLYHYDKNGTLITQITDGPWEFRGIVRLDQEKGEVFFNCTADSPIATGLYAVNLDGSNLRQLTPDRGTHRTSVSPGGSYIVDSWSNTNNPDTTVLRDNTGTLLRTLDTNPVFERDDWQLGTVEHLSIPASRSTEDEQITLEAMLIYPPDFDPDTRYPVWYSTYAGPHAPTVRDSWSGGRTADHMLATAGFLVFKGDPYSASGKGARSAWTAYKQLGVPEMEDINDLMEWLKAQPFVDASRIGMSGFSYGGFITSYAMTHSDHFTAGIAGGSVTSWADYDTIYTERFMDTPQENPDGYANTSVVVAAKNLHGKLLLIQGWMDDNVHPQNSIKLIKALQDADKDFEMMFYPRFGHGIWGKHYRRLNYDFKMRLVE